MFRRNDPEARLDDLAALISATTAADLHKALVLGPPAAYEREVNTPLTYFRNAHDKDPARSVETAMLLGTDLRWSVAAGPLIEAIEATGIVPPDELDLLARAFISADAKVYWRCPDGWFSTVGIAVSDIEFPPAAPDADPDDSEETGPTVASRVVAPGLRRWAAARAVRLDPSAWPAVLARSHEVGAAGGGGLMHGLLDSIEVLPLKARSLVRQEALNSGRSDVRQACASADRADRLVPRSNERNARCQ